MQQRYDAAQLSQVIDQALVYQCACPAQVCRAIFELRDLYDYQMNCANDSTNDRLVHEAIANTAQLAHEAMESCLAQVLEIEGWNPTDLIMPVALRKKPAKSV
ncbi:MAG: hypothetical protein H7232_05585 [Aeromicrobium sp.]|nr:hypothetical protein [Burkholderiales bacterium]